MFRQVINNCAMTTTEADGYFSHVWGEPFSNDLSLVATFRALVAPRMGEDENLYVTFSSSTYSKDDVASVSVPRFIKRVCNVTRMGEGQVQIVSFNHYQEDNYAALEAIKSGFEETFPGWHRLERVTEFYRRQFYVLCFVNPDSKNAILYIDSLDLKKLHYLQCSVMAFLPWYFPPEQGISELEMSLVKSLRENSPEHYLEYLAKIAEQYDFRTMRVKQLLAGFETAYERRQLENAQNDIKNYYSHLEALNREYGDYLRAIREKEILTAGLEAKIASGGEESEIMEYFLCNKNVLLESVEGTKMKFVTKTYLDFYDEDLAEECISNAHSVIYEPNGRRCNNYIPAEDMKKLMTAIFIDQTMRIKFCSAYEFTLDGYVHGLSSYNYPAELNDRMPNTHIDRYSCLGSYEREINEALTHHNYIGAIEQCIASGKSLNFADSYVMREFMCRFYGINGSYSARKFIELPDGTSATPKEAVEWLKAQEVTTNE